MKRVALAVACALASAVLVGFSSSKPVPARSAAGDAAATRMSGATQRLATGPLATGLVDTIPFLVPEAPTNFRHVRATGATYVRLILYWKLVGLMSPSRPAGFDASDPSDPNYQWASFDRMVTLAVAAGLRPIICIQQAPAWAERGTTGDLGTREPNPADIADFAHAAAVRYGGGYLGLPRVRYWQVWNEPNYSAFLTPQSPDLYRSMVNAFSDAVHGVHADNVVIAGGLSPFGFKGVADAPLPFMRDLLCISSGSTPKPTCSDRIRFDVWSDHPYTTGGPTHRATNPGDASLGDLPVMRKVLDAAIKSGHIVSRAPIRFWVTEFSWDTNPPDPIGVPMKLHARWVAEALYRMWKAGVSEVTWFQLRDDSLKESQFQSGLYFAGPSYAADKPKLSREAFRFPFVAYRSGRGAYVWGRTPFALPGVVAIQRFQHGWKHLGLVRTNGYGVFQKRFATGTGTAFRAFLTSKGHETSLPFSLTQPKDRYYWPFGCGGILPCTTSSFKTEAAAFGPPLLKLP